MPTALALPLFVASLAVALGSAAVFARTLDRLGVRIGMPEALLGLLTALAADGPEITSAIVALVKGAGEVSLGVLVGSNLFNLAAMLGFTVLLAGRIRLPRETLALEGTVGLLVTLIAAALVLGLVPPAAAIVLVGAVVLPYLLLLTRGRQLARRLPFPERLDRSLARALSEREHWGHHHRLGEGGVWRLLAVMAPAVVLIVLGSTGMVETALSLADTWHVPHALVGVLLLAPLTSIPNAFTAARLGLAGRGAALVSETFNSNTINLLVGVAVPALVVSIVSITAETIFVFASLILMTLASLLVLSRADGMRRADGGLLIGLYLLFCALAIARAS